MCKKLGLEANFHILNDREPKNVILNYIVRSLNSTFFLPESLKKIEPNFVYSVTEHYYDVAPALILKKRFKCQWKAVIHWVAPIKRNGNLLSNVLFYIQQRLGLMLIKNNADDILAVSTKTKDSLIQIGYNPLKIHAVACGVDLQRINEIYVKNRDNDKKYDAIFIKRFHSAKGVFDTIRIWEEVVKSKPNAKLILIGGGSEKILTSLQKIIKDKNLSKNIIIKGIIYDFEIKMKLIMQSKMFILPSYEENWAIVIGEALASRIPVICYDIPEIRPIWDKYVKWVEKGNITNFAEEIIKTLDEGTSEDVNDLGREYMERYDWLKISNDELSFKKFD
mgnify:CR=1 FL=1